MITKWVHTKLRHPLTQDSEDSGSRRDPPLALAEGREGAVWGRKLPDGDELSDEPHHHPQS